MFLFCVFRLVNKRQYLNTMINLYLSTCFRYNSTHSLHHSNTFVRAFSFEEYIVLIQDRQFVIIIKRYRVPIQRIVKYEE